MPFPNSQQLKLSHQLHTSKLHTTPAQAHTHTHLTMPSPAAFASSIAANVTKSKSSTLAVLPLVLASAAVTGYARATAAAQHAQAAPQELKELDAHDAELLHQHVVYPWKGTR